MTKMNMHRILGSMSHKMILICLVLGLLCIAMTGCNSSAKSSQTESNRTGMLTFSISLAKPADQSLSSQPGINRAIDCELSMIGYIQGEVYDENYEYLSGTNLIPCSSHHATISNIDVGLNRKLVVTAQNSDGVIIYKGEKTGIPILQDEINDAGEIALYPIGYIKGTVKDSVTGNPIADASVVIYSDSMVVDELTTDTDGEYLSELDPSLVYDIVVSADHYASDSQTGIAVSIGARTLVESLLTPGENYGSLSGNIKDAVTNIGIDAVSVDFYESGAAVGHVITDSSGQYSTSLPTGYTYTLKMTKTDYVDVTYNNVAVTSDHVNYLETVPQVGSEYAGLGDISGIIKDAFSGVGIDGLALTVREGINTQSGPAVATLTTLSDGSYSILNLAGGNYTIETNKTNYTTTYFSVYSVGGVATANQNASVAPLVQGVRIVLTWGAIPSDLDSHITGPDPSSSGQRFHVWYSDPGSELSSPYTQLDVDQQNGYGPETITIYQQVSGVYRYSVHDYTNSGSLSSTALSQSGAQVKVYMDNLLVATYNVPSDQGGIMWTVFELDGTKLTPINTMTYTDTAP